MKSLLFLFLSFSAMAQSNIVFDQISTTGTGCLPGTTSTTYSPDGTSFSLLFDEFRVEVPNHEQPAPPAPVPGRGPSYRPPQSASSIFLNQKICNIVFNTTLPAGRMATSITIKLQARGNTLIDPGIQAYFTTILVGHRGLANSVGPQVKVVDKKMWTGRDAVAEDWIADTTATVPLQSSCSTATNRSIKFELKNHLEAKILNNNPAKNGILTVDSNDASGMLTFTVATAPCR